MAGQKAQVETQYDILNREFARYIPQHYRPRFGITAERPEADVPQNTKGLEALVVVYGALKDHTDYMKGFDDHLPPRVLMVPRDVPGAIAIPGEFNLMLHRNTAKPKAPYHNSYQDLIEFLVKGDYKSFADMALDLADQTMKISKRMQQKRTMRLQELQRVSQQV